MASCKRFLLYSQHLSGTGHFVRTFEIARALASRHDVYLVDGGRPVPRATSPHSFARITLPRIYRAVDGIRAVDITRDIEEVMQDRKRILLEAVDDIRPDVVLIEHFPFSKLHLRSEIVPIITLAREVNNRSRVISSIRDISPRTANEPDPDQYRREVLHLLSNFFDGILVHADPAFVRLEECVPWAGEIPVPIEYTGYVSEKPAGKACHIKASPDQNTISDDLVIASAGGSGSEDLLTHYIDAWKRADRQGAVAKYKLVIFAPLFLPEHTLRSLRERATGSQIEIRHFTPGLVDWMCAADLTINEAGYNTCTNILETRTPAILIPNPLMSDQSLRASRFAASRLATVIESRDVNPDRLARTIIETLGRPESRHNIDLDGAQKTLDILG